MGILNCDQRRAPDFTLLSGRVTAFLIIVLLAAAPAVYFRGETAARSGPASIKLTGRVGEEPRLAGTIYVTTMELYIWQLLYRLTEWGFLFFF